ncbi:MAG: hypothetical protein IJ411_01625 [Oscillospiraceae bacterium]|nr:hypothetical protein [Oscillospiraceae bacterium]
MKQGYDVFGEAYAVMLRKDLHHSASIDHELMRNMILLDPESVSALYSKAPDLPKGIVQHPLYNWAQQFRRSSAEDSVRKALAYVSTLAEQYTVPFEEMHFGGTEQQILQRGSDWCADLARVGLVLLNCLEIPARILHLADTSRAYWGHVVCEAYLNGRWAVCDFVHGFFLPYSGWELHREREKIPALLGEERNWYAGYFRAVAVSDYDPMDERNDYSISEPNEYYLTMMRLDQNGQWLMGEEQDMSV